MPATAPELEPAKPLLAPRVVDFVLVVALAIVFVGMAWPFIAGLGIEVDETLAAAGVYPGINPLYAMEVGDGRSIPLMLITYLGALKVWICAPIFLLFGPDEITLRLPMVVLCGLSIILFWRLMREHSRCAAWIAVILLATDTTYLLLASTDFGPNVLQWLLKIAVILLFVRWKRSGRLLPLVAGAFLAGLALWDKATFLWIGAGMMIAAALAFPADFKRALNLRTVGLAAAAFALGALPFIIYNVDRPLMTFHTNARVAPGEAISKLVHLQGTLDGSLLRGFLVAWEKPPHPGVPHDPVEHVVAGLNRHFQLPLHNWTIWAIAVSLVALPFVWRTPARAPAIFAIVSFLIAWIAMATTAGGGAAAHHVALLWPMQFILIAVVFAQLTTRKWGRLAVYSAVAILVAVSLGVTLRYYGDLIRNGPGPRWNTAIFALRDYIQSAHPARVIIVDWGIVDSLEFLAEGEIPAEHAYNLVAPGVPADRGSPIVAQMTSLGTIFVTHAPQYTEVPERDAAVESFAARAGLQKIPVKTIADDFGRDVYLVYRYQ